MSLAELVAGDIIYKANGQPAYWKILTIERPLRSSSGKPHSTKRKARFVIGEMQMKQGAWSFVNRDMSGGHEMTLTDAWHEIIERTEKPTTALNIYGAPKLPREEGERLDAYLRAKREERNESAI